VFFVETAIMLVPAVTEVIITLASVSGAGVAKAFEFGLSKLIVLVIGLFAKLIGLGDLAKRVQKIFKKIRKRVDKVVRDLFKKANRAGRKLMRTFNKKKSAKKIKEENKNGEPEKLTAQDKAKHKKYVKAIKEKLSEPSHDGETFEQFHKRKEKQGEELENKYQPKLKKGINVNIELTPLKQDQKDNDIDFKISIAPNTEKDKGNAKYNLGLPPHGMTYFIRQKRKDGGDHYKVFTYKGDLYDLEKNVSRFVEKRIRHKGKGKQKFEVIKQPAIEIRLVPGATSAPAEDYVLVEIGTITNKVEVDVQKIIDDYNTKGYELDVADCFSFAEDLLAEGFGLGIKSEGDDNRTKFESIKK
jgi:hypothetical protein